MKRVRLRWTAIAAVATLLALPAAVQAQPPQPSSAPAPAPSGPAQAGESREPAVDQHRIAHEHLYKAEAVLSGIPAESIPADAQARVAEVKRHIGNLRQAGTDSSGTRDTGAPRGSSRSDELAAIERILTELLGPGSASGTPPEPGRTIGTTGIAGNAATLDESARSSLQQVRTHLTAYAAAIGSVTGETEASGSPREAGQDPPNSDTRPSSASSPPTADSASPMTSPTDPTPSPTGTSPTSMPQTPEPDNGRRGSQPTGGGQSPAGTAGSPQENGPSRQHLVAARNALTEFTQMPGASDISGETRTQISQLISNFNQMIVTDTAWRASLGKVKANLRSLLAEGATAATAPQAQSSAPSNGAVAGTAGQSPLEPQFRAKLLEFEAHLQAFEHAVTGGSPAAAPIPSGGAEPLDPPSELHAGRTADRLDQDPAAEPAIPGAAGSTTYTGSQDPGRTAQSASRPDSTTTTQTAAPGRGEALKHIAAIEAILLGQSAPPGTSSGSRPAASAGHVPAGETTGTSGGPAQPGAALVEKGPTLEEAQIDEIRVHLRELRRLLGETRGQ